MRSSGPVKIWASFLTRGRSKSSGICGKDKDKEEEQEERVKEREKGKGVEIEKEVMTPFEGSAGLATPDALAPSPPPLEWKFSQVFGERTAGEEIQEVDVISAIEFDGTGEHLATGDRGGRVVLFERTDGRDPRPRRELERAEYSFPKHPEYRYKTEFQSHDPEFDYLKSLDIEEKINKIRWCRSVNGALFLLSTNDKTIKLWKVHEKKLKKVSEMNVDPSMCVANGGSAKLGMNGHAPRAMNGSIIPNDLVSSNNFAFPPEDIASVRLPTVYSNEISHISRCKKVYAHAHDYHINSISRNRLPMRQSIHAIERGGAPSASPKPKVYSDGETYISTDDLRINLWNLEITDQSFNIVDIKPTNMEDLTEVITCAEFHPSHCNTLAYSSSKGTIRLLDMRQSALCDRHAKLFEEQEVPGQRSFFTEIIASISDIKFARGGRYLLSRDYMNLKLWDLNMESAPVASFKVHDHLSPKLCDLYEKDSIFDKFECCLSGDGLRVATGSYSHLFRVFGVTPGSEEATTLEASRTPHRRLVPVPSKPTRSLTNFARRANRRVSESLGNESAVGGGAHDFTAKLLHLAWHPTANLIACAASNSLYMYYA